MPDFLPIGSYLFIVLFGLTVSAIIVICLSVKGAFLHCNCIVLETLFLGRLNSPLTLGVFHYSTVASIRVCFSWKILNEALMRAVLTSPPHPAPPP
jgi:purine-cytosine permease-like protein